MLKNISNQHTVEQYHAALRQLALPRAKNFTDNQPLPPYSTDVKEVNMVDGFNQVIQVPGDMNPDPRGIETGHTQPHGGLRYYQDDVDTTGKQDLITAELSDDPSTRHVPEPAHLKVMNSEDVREAVEDSDQGDKRLA